MNLYRYSSLILISFLIFTSLNFAACPNDCTSPKRVYFKNIRDNQKVTETFKVLFGQQGLEVKPAGLDIDNPSAGHFHILIDDVKKYVPEGVVVPSDPNHIHYGKGETETILTLTPGEHTLTLQFADGAHRSYGKKLATTITVYVVKRH